MNPSLTAQFIGKNKTAIKAQLASCPSTEFLHWLYLPTLDLLLTFDKQQCQTVLKLN